MPLPQTIQFHIIVALLASMCGDTMFAITGTDRDERAMVVFADATVATGYVENISIDPDDPSGDGILLDVAVCPLRVDFEICDISDSPSLGDTARRWLQSRAPPFLNRA